MTHGGFIEYPHGIDERIQKFKTDLEEAYFPDLDMETQEEVLAEIKTAYKFYYITKTYKPEFPSDAKRNCDRMITSANKMQKSIGSINDPIKLFYELWMHRNASAGALKTALENHVKALGWVKSQLDTVSKPEHQRETGARNQFKESLKAIYRRNNPPSETAEFNDNLGAFIVDTLDAFDL